DLRSRLQACISSLESPRAITTPAVGERLAGRFELQAPISTGGLLHRAIDIEPSSRIVLLAVLPAEAVPDSAALDTLDRDIRTLKERPHHALLAPLDLARGRARELVRVE